MKKIKTDREYNKAMQKYDKLQSKRKYTPEGYSIRMNEKTEKIIMNLITSMMEYNYSRFLSKDLEIQKLKR